MGFHRAAAAAVGDLLPGRSAPGGAPADRVALPTTHVFAAAQEVVAGNPLPWDEVGIAAASALVLAAFAVWFLTHMLSVFRSRGYISRHV